MSKQDTVPMASHADEDDVLDLWLASLQISEFEYLLSRLADDQMDILAAATG